jgi:hypothetical protein
MRGSGRTGSAIWCWSYPWTGPSVAAHSRSARFGWASRRGHVRPFSSGCSAGFSLSSYLRKQKGIATVRLGQTAGDALRFTLLYFPISWLFDSLNKQICSSKFRCSCSNTRQINKVRSSELKFFHFLNVACQNICL